MTSTDVIDASVLLVFGYGSIMWKQNFAYTSRRPCCVPGYRRVLFQGSADHRGVPGKLGRVATLLPCGPGQNDAGGESWVAGIAFELPVDRKTRAEILAQLDHREVGGYSRVVVAPHDLHTHQPLALPDGAVCLCYMASAENSDYLGEASEEAIAAQMLECAGDSGPNSEYLFKLAEELRKLQVVDDHVFSVEVAALRLMEQNNRIKRGKE